MAANAPQQRPPEHPEKAPSKQNPAFRALGLPSWRPKLPSRNWLIFLSITGSWTCALLYDRRQKKLQQQKWCTLVQHLADDHLSTNKLQRRLTVYLQAPPGDGIRSAREHFLEYVKPILVSAAMDWEVVEGRREGEIRAGLAERIRRKRRKEGEHGESPEHTRTVGVQEALEVNRQRTGVEEWDGVGGDLVIGRHTWKEYVRGMHEGWLGPINAPPRGREDLDNQEEREERALETTDVAAPLQRKSKGEKNKSDMHAAPEPELMQTSAAETTDEVPVDSSVIFKDAETENEKPKESEPASKPLVPPAFDTPSSYPASCLSPCTPNELAPSSPIDFPHLLGFLNTPIRMYRFITRRYVADDIGRQTAAAVLAAHRPFNRANSAASSPSSNFDSNDEGRSSVTVDTQGSLWEQQDVLRNEELEWHKSVRKREADNGKEREWTDPIVLDGRVAMRMRKFELDREDEERAERIARGAKGVPGRTEDRKSDYEG